MTGKISKFALISAMLCHSAITQAYQPYHATVIVDDISAHVSAPNLVDLNRDLRSDSITKLIPLYTPESPVAIDINLRGIEAISSFAAGSTTLVVEIPQANTTRTFSGATRDASWQLFKEFIRDGGDHHRLLRAYAKFSPIDPIAGNPNSLMASMAQADYLLGRLSPLSGCDPCWDAQPIRHQFQAGSIIGRAFSDPFDTTTINSPLRYSYSPKRTWAFILDLPLTFNINGGAYSVFGSVGSAFRLPITTFWSLTSIMRLGFGGSFDLCVSGSFFDAGLTSELQYKMWNHVFSMTNYAGYFSSTNLWLGGINFNYHLHNWIFKNGINITSCKGFCVLGRPLNYNVSFTDSYFATGRLFIRHYDEVGISLIANYVNPFLEYDSLSIGFSYQFGQEKYKGYFFNMAYQF